MKSVYHMQRADIGLISVDIQGGNIDMDVLPPPPPAAPQVEPQWGRKVPNKKQLM